MNASDVATRVKDQFGDTSSIQVSDPMILRWINDALLDFAVQNEIFRARAKATTLAGQQTYGVPSDLLKLKIIKFNFDSLEELSDGEADQYIRRNDEHVSTGIPTHYWIWDQDIYLWPTPNSSGDLVVYYISKPSEVTDMSATINIPDEYRPRLVEYCLQQAYEMDENFQAGNMKAQQLQAGLLALKNIEEPERESFYAGVTYIPDDSPTDYLC